MTDRVKDEKAACQARARVYAAAAVAMLVLLTVATYWVVLNHEFLQFDDAEYVTKNPVVMNGITWEGIRWAFTTLHFSNWHPLTWISHMLDVEMFGLDPRGHHGVSVFFHVVNTLLLLGVLCRLTKSFWPSYVVAAWFAIHPLHVESVAWIAERKDVLSTLFGLLVIGAYARYARNPRRSHYFAVFLLFALALMSKPMMITLPCVLLLLDYWPLDRMRDSQQKLQSSLIVRRVIEKLPLAALSLASAAITFIAQSRGGAVGSLERFSFDVRAANAIVAYGEYLLATLWPSGLAVLYPHPGKGVSWVAAGSTAAALALITMLAFLHFRTRPFLVVGWLWFLGMLVPVIGLVQVGEQSHADRYMYLPIVGLFVMIVWGIHSVTSVRFRPAAFVVALMVAVAWAALAHAQARHWHDSQSLFRRALAVTEDNYVAHTSLGTALLREGQTELAYSHFQKAHTINPKYPEVLNNIGYVLLLQNQPDQALEILEEAVHLYPTYVEAHLNLGIALASARRFEESIPHLEYAVKRRPEMPGAWFNLAMAHFAREDFSAAATAFREVVRQSPHDVDARRQFGIALMRSGDGQAAMAEFTKVLEIRPGDSEVEAYLKQLEATGVNR